MDDDIPGQQGAEKFARKLGVGRCYIVRTRGGGSEGPKDANDAMRLRWEIRNEAVEAIERSSQPSDDAESSSSSESEGTEASEEQRRQQMEIPEVQRMLQMERVLDLSHMIESAELVQHGSIIRFRDVRSKVRRNLSDYVEAAGTAFGTQLKGLNTILKGHRPGELTVFTGRTGQGKTTMVSQVSLDLACNDVHTLWGSFEVKNEQLATKMLQQHAQRNLKGCSDDEFDAAADAFEGLPLWFLTYYGSTKLDNILDAMEYAVYAYDVRHVVLDNLQFMSAGLLGRGQDVFSVLDESIGALRMFASDKGVHITLVVHPRKEDDGKLLQVSSIFGSGKATQESDNVIILQDNGVYRFLDVKKNRHDGELGTVPFQFDPECMRYREMSPQEIFLLRQKVLSESGARGE